MKRKYNSQELFRSLASLLIGVPIYLFIDSPMGDDLFGNGQYVTNFLVFLIFIRAYRHGAPRTKHVLLIGMFVGLVGEFLFSKIFGMYHYRFDNIPLWLAFGHGLIFAWVYKVSRNKNVLNHQKLIQTLLFLSGMVYSIVWYFLANDAFGLLTAVTFAAILFAIKKSRMFFLIMFIVVCYIEQVGVAAGCWYWPATVLGDMTWIPSGNPPSGVAVFYFLFDAVVFWIYIYVLHPKVRLRYQRLRHGTKTQL